MGQTFGGSGGPITAFIDRRNVVVGMQFRQPDKQNYNFSIAAEGPFLEFVQEHVPDLKVY